MLDVKDPTASRSRRRTWPRVTVWRVVALAAVFASLMAFAPMNARADANQLTILRNWQTGQCLDSNETGAVYEGTCDGRNSQTWFVLWTHQVDSAGHYIVEFEDNQTGLCLTTENESTSSGGGNVLPVFTTSCNNSSGQSWLWYGDSTVGQYHNLANQACLDNNGSAVYALTCNGGGYQDWRQGY